MSAIIIAKIAKLNDDVSFLKSDISDSSNSQNKLLIKILNTQVNINNNISDITTQLSDVRGKMVNLTIQTAKIPEMKKQTDKFRDLSFVFKYGWIIAVGSFTTCLGFFLFLVSKINPDVLRALTGTS